MDKSFSQFSPPDSSLSEISLTMALFYLLLPLVILFSFFPYRPVPLHGSFPPIRSLEAAKSLWDLGTLSPKAYYEIAQSVTERSRNEDALYFQDAFSLSKTGKLLPKHSLFSVLIATPLYGHFGLSGIIFLQIGMLLSILTALFILCRHFVPHAKIFQLVVLVFFSSLWHLNILNYTFESHEIFCLLAGAAISLRFPFWGGMLMGLSVFVRPSSILLGGLVALSLNRDRMNTAMKIIGVLAALSLFCTWNTFAWGHPFTTAYSRVLQFENGQAFLGAHSLGFELSELGRAWGQKLFSLDHGLFFYSFALFVSPILLVRNYSRSDPIKGQDSVIVASLVYMLYIFSYPHWNVSSSGNRFLHAATLFCIPALLSAISRERKE